MADEEVVADVQEPAQEAPAAEAQVEALDLLPDAPVDEGADDTAPSADATPVSLDELIERDEKLREQLDARLKERENAGANRREAQLKREAGKKEVTTRNVQRWLAENGIEVDDTSRLAYFFDLATAHEAMELATNVPDALLRNHPVPVDAREKAVEARERGDWDGYVSTLLNGAVEAEVAKRTADNEKRITTEVNKRLAAEIKARGIEKAPQREGAPHVPLSGASKGMTMAELDAMPTEVFLAKSPEERQRLVNEAKTNSRLAGAASR